MPKTLDLIIIFAIFHYYQYYMRIIDVYNLKPEYKPKKFIKTIYYSYKQVVNKSNSRKTSLKHYWYYTASWC